MAHDFNNLLTVVIGNTELARALLPAQSPAMAHVDALSAASWLASGLVRDLLGYAGCTHPRVGRTEVGPMVSGLLGLLKHTLRKNVEVELSLAKELPPMQADENQIRQVLMNLLLNAADAIGDRTGTILVGVEFAPSRGRNRSSPLVVFSVSDNGCGMSEEVRRRIFDPFFTTKPHGRGLGLAAVRGIVAAHNGTIELESEVGRGTTFRVSLPCAEPEHCAGVEHKTPSILPTPQALLLADDDEDVRGVIASMLRSQGHTILEAHDVTTALEALREHGAKIQVVLVDRTLKGGGAKPILDEVGGPGAFPVIILSAVGESSSEEFDFAEVLAKPFTIAKAQGALVRVMAK